MLLLKGKLKAKGVEFMDCNIKVIRKQEQTTSNWSGGTTTQLAIYPETSEYNKRNFKWRLSSARVDLEESTFTSLPGIKRLIMTINGEMKLVHDGHHSAVLKPFQQDTFMGDWNTKSFGRVRDFNLMLSYGADGAIEAINLNNEIKRFEYTYEKSEKIFEAFYMAHGDAEIKAGTSSFNLSEGDFMLVELTGRDIHFDVELKSLENSNCDIIRANILC